MTKMIKMSLVAALAVSGLSASIKDASVSGKFEVEFDRTTSKAMGGNETSTNAWDMDVDATVKVPLADSITGILTVQADGGDTINQTNTQPTATANSNVNVAKHYISAKVGSATVNVGQQSVGAPFFDDERGSGIVALMPAGAVTLAAANFTNVNSGVGAAISAEDISALAVIGGANNVKYSLWYATISNVATAYTFNANTKVGQVALDLTHTSADYGDLYGVNGGHNGAFVNAAAQGKSASLTKVAATMAVNKLSVTGAYGMTNDDADRGVGVDLTSDGDASVNFCGELYCVDDLRGASAILLGASTNVSGVTVGAHYLTGSYDASTTATAADRDFNELAVKASKSLNKSTKLTAHYTELSMAVEYKF
jgi:hypothetical protein